MKRRFLLVSITLFLIFSEKTSLAFDIQGIQPVHPYGIFSVFSAYNIEKGNMGMMVSAERSIDPNFYRFSLNAEYGLTDNTDLILNLPVITNYYSSEGLADTSIGFKQKFLSEKNLGPAVSYIFTFSVPGKDQFSSEGRIGAGLVVSKRVGPFLGNMNLFYYKSTNSSLEDEIELRLGADLSAAHDFHFLAEFLVKKSHFSENVDQLEGRVGYRVRFSPDSVGTIGIGYDFKNRTPELRIFMSIGITYPFKKREIKRIYEEE